MIIPKHCLSKSQILRTDNKELNMFRPSSFIKNKTTKNAEERYQ